MSRKQTSNIQLGTILHFNDFDKYKQVVNKFYKEYGEIRAPASPTRMATATALATVTGTATATMMATETGAWNRTIKNMKTNETFEFQYYGNNWCWFQREDFNFITIATNIIPDGNEDFAVIEMKTLNDCGEIQQGTNIYMRQHVVQHSTSL